MCVGNLRNFSAVKLEMMAYILFVGSWHPFHLCAELTLNISSWFLVLLSSVFTFCYSIPASVFDKGSAWFPLHVARADVGYGSIQRVAQKLMLWKPLVLQQHVQRIVLHAQYSKNLVKITHSIFLGGGVLLMVSWLALRVMSFTPQLFQQLQPQ